MITLSVSVHLHHHYFQSCLSYSASMSSPIASLLNSEQADFQIFSEFYLYSHYFLLFLTTMWNKTLGTFSFKKGVHLTVTQRPLYLFYHLYMVVPLYLLQQPTLTAGIQHPLLNTTAVSWHRVDEHWCMSNRKVLKKKEKKNHYKGSFLLSWLTVILSLAGRMKHTSAFTSWDRLQKDGKTSTILCINILPFLSVTNRSCT